MLREEAVAILSEQGSECIGNPIQNAKLKKWCHFHKNDPNNFIFGQKSDIDHSDLSESFAKIWDRYDVTMTSYKNFTQFADFGHNSLTSADYHVEIVRWKPFSCKDQCICYKMRDQPTFHLFLFKICGRDKFGPIL